MESVNEGSLPSLFLLQLLTLKILQYSSLIIPISLFFGILVSLNRFYVSNEMVIMKLGGFSCKAISSVLSKIILVATMIVMLFNFFVTPYVINFRTYIEHKILHEQRIYSLQEKNFNQNNNGSKIVYISNKNKIDAGNIFIKSKNKDSVRIDISSGLESSDNNHLTLIEGISYVFKPNDGLSYTKYSSQNIQLSNQVPDIINNDIDSKSIIDLLKINSIESYQESIKRFSLIIATFILGYMAIPLSHINAREDKYRNIFTAVLFYFSYIILINILSKSFDSELYVFLSLLTLHLLYSYITYRLYNFFNQPGYT
jgi:lipopolysaccharide export system permease protein